MNTPQSVANDLGGNIKIIEMEHLPELVSAAAPKISKTVVQPKKAKSSGVFKCCKCLLGVFILIIAVLLRLVFAIEIRIFGMCFETPKFLEIEPYESSDNCQKGSIYVFSGVVHMVIIYAAT